MKLQDTDIQKSNRITQAVNEYFETSNELRVQAKELMSLFIQKKIFKSNYSDGLPIRNFLRHLDRNQKLDLIPQVHAERKQQNTNWFFIKPGKA